jgi:hypothetical protein
MRRPSVLEQTSPSIPRQRSRRTRSHGSSPRSATVPRTTRCGYVQSATAEDGHALLAEIGVVQSRRGYRYVDDLLAYGTLAALRSGATLLLSDTDQDNHPMRAAFARAGYVEFASRRDFRWVA